MPYLNVKKIITALVAGLLLATQVYASNKDTLIIGKISPIPDAAISERLQLEAEVIAQEMKGVGIEKVDVYLSKSIADMMDALRSGKIDWVSDSFYMSLLLAEKTNSEIFFNTEKEVDSKSTVFFGRKNGRLETIDNLEKKIILFSDDMSSTQYFIPFYELTYHGYIPKIYGQSDEAVGATKKRIFYRFEPDQAKMIENVLLNGLNIGVVSGDVYEKMPKSLKDKIKIIYQTIAYPDSLELIRNDLDVEIKERLKKLLKRKRKPESRPLIDDRRFGRFIAEGRDGYVLLKNIIKHNVVPEPLGK